MLSEKWKRRVQQTALGVALSCAVLLLMALLAFYVSKTFPNRPIMVTGLVFGMWAALFTPITLIRNDIPYGRVVPILFKLYFVILSMSAVLFGIAYAIWYIRLDFELIYSIFALISFAGIAFGWLDLQKFDEAQTANVSPNSLAGAVTQHHVRTTSPATYAQFLQPSQREAYRADIAEGLTKFRDLKWVDFDESAIQQEWEKGFLSRDTSVIYKIAESANTAAHDNWTRAQGLYNDAVAYVDKMRSSLRASAEIATASLAKYKIDYSAIHVPQSDRLLGLSDKAKLAPPKFYTKLNVAGNMGKLAGVGIRSGNPWVALFAIAGTVAYELSRQQEAQRRIMEFQGECRTQIRAITQQIGTFEALIAERVKPQFDEINASIEALETFTEGLRRREAAGSMDAPDAPVFLNKFAFELVKARQIAETKAGEA
jgi:hypothetical protein